MSLQKSLLLVAVGLLSIGQASAQEAAEPMPILTLARAVSLALEKNDRLLGSRDSVEQADLSVRLARSSFRPKVVPNVLGSFGQTDVSNQTYRLDLSQRLTTGTELRATAASATSQNQLGSYYNTDTTLQLSQPLLRGFGKGVARRNLTSAEARRADAARQQGLSEQQVTLEVAGTYYRIVAQKRLIASAEKSLERAKNLLEASTAKLGVGRVSQLDVFRAQQLVAQAEGQLLDARGAVEDAKDQLRGLFGEGADFGFEVGDAIPKAIEPISAEQAVDIALERRLELRSAEEAISESERAAKFAKNQLLPQLDINFALTRRETAESFRSSFKFDHFRFATFFAVSLPMDRTAQTVELHNAVIERDRRRREAQTLRLRIAEQARRAVRQQERLLRGLEVADQSVQFAEKELEVANLRYQRGLSNNLDVVSAEGNVLAAEGRRVGILAELAVARLSLRATLGTLDPRKDVGGEG
jgi:outer membrane protein TolC